MSGTSAASVTSGSSLVTTLGTWRYVEYDYDRCEHKSAGSWSSFHQTDGKEKTMAMFSHSECSLAVHGQARTNNYHDLEKLLRQSEKVRRGSLAQLDVGSSPRNGRVTNT